MQYLEISGYSKTKTSKRLDLVTSRAFIFTCKLQASTICQVDMAKNITIIEKSRVRRKKKAINKRRRNAYSNTPIFKNVHSVKNSKLSNLSTTKPISQKC